MSSTAFPPDFAAATWGQTLGGLTSVLRFPCDVRRGRRLRNSRPSSILSIAHQLVRASRVEPPGKLDILADYPVLGEHLRAPRRVGVNAMDDTALPAGDRHRWKFCERTLTFRR